MSERGRMISIDLGGSHVSAGLIDVASGRVRTFLRVPLPPNSGRDELLARITGVAADVVEGAFEGVGVAVPGPFDYANGVCLLTHKLEPLHGVDMKRALADALRSTPASITFVNDADAFLLGEAWAGAARGHRRAAGVTLGTGLGSAFLEAGRIVDTGPRVPFEGSLHLVAYRGRPAEETVSGAALLRSYGDPRVDVRDVALRARNGDRRARRVFDELASALGEITAPWLDSFGASCLVVGGSISQAWDLLGRGLHAALAPIDGLEKIVPAERVDDAALLGAARHAAATVARGARVGVWQ
ncbi:MAG TPA: ROK family protein [Gaiella sp.]